MKKYSLKNLDKLLKERLSIPENRNLTNTNIPGFGTFSLEPIQICLIACITEFYFGNKKIVYDILNETFYQKNLRLAASLDYRLKNLYTIIENEENKIALDSKTAETFIKACKDSNLIDTNYNILNDELVVNKNVITGAAQLQSSNGFLFELFLNFCISDLNYEIEKKEDHIKYLCKIKDVKYSISILSVIYKYKNISNISSYFDQNNQSFVLESAHNLYKVFLNNDTLQKKINDLIHEDLHEDTNLKFKFQFEEGYANNPIDLFVYYDNKIISMLDLKSVNSSKSENKYKISKSKKAIDKQINNVMGEQESGSNHDFYLGNIILSYTFNAQQINVNDIKALYVSYNSQHEEILNKNPEKKENLEKKEYSIYNRIDPKTNSEKKLYGSYRMISANTLSSSDENKPITNKNLIDLSFDFKDRLKKQDEHEKNIKMKDFILNYLETDNPYSFLKKSSAEWSKYNSYGDYNEEDKNKIKLKIKNIIQENKEKKIIRYIYRYITILSYENNLINESNAKKYVFKIKEYDKLNHDLDLQYECFNENKINSIFRNHFTLYAKVFLQNSEKMSIDDLNEALTIIKKENFTNKQTKQNIIKNIVQVIEYETLKDNKKDYIEDKIKEYMTNPNIKPKDKKKEIKKAYSKVENELKECIRYYFLYKNNLIDKKRINKTFNDLNDIVKELLLKDEELKKFLYNQSIRPDDRFKKPLKDYYLKNDFYKKLSEKGISKDDAKNYINEYFAIRNEIQKVQSNSSSLLPASYNKTNYFDSIHEYVKELLLIDEELKQKVISLTKQKSRVRQNFIIDLNNFYTSINDSRIYGKKNKLLREVYQDLFREDQ
jgi:hypothetical protein